MRIRSNTLALNAQRHAGQIGLDMARSLERLSSGLRINRASDDAGGLSISETFRTQVRGQQQAVKNVQDGLSLVQTADGGLNEIQAILQRGRELAVQAANGSLTSADRQAIQTEIDQLLPQIDMTAKQTTFNGIAVLGGSSFTAADYAAVTNALNNSLMADAYAVVAAAYGITINAPNTRPLDIYLDEISPGGVLAYVQATGGPFTPALELHVDMYDFINGGGVGSPPLLNDRILTHEFVHAAMFDQTNFAALPTWFMEGTAEFAQGADERVTADLAAMGGDTPANRASLLARVSAAGWGGTSADYSAAYTATRYLDSRLRAMGLTNGIKDAMAYLDGNAAGSMDGVVALAGYANQAAFLADLQGGNGLTWMNANMSAAQLADADTGSIRGSQYGGAVLDFNSVVPNGVAGDPTPWVETFKPSTAAPLIIQAGANAGETISLVGVTITATGLGLSSLNVLTQTSAQGAIASFDAAIAQVTQSRATFGAQANQLEHALASLGVSVENQSGAESRIRDTDMAQEASSLTRAQVLSQSNLAIQSVANLSPLQVASILLKGI